MTLPTFKRPDDGNDRVVCIKRHIAAPIPRDMCCKPATPAPAPELKDVSSRPVDMHQLRRAFPDRWGEFCRTHFRDAEHLALFMGCDERTARYWIEGKHAPAAPFVIRAVTAFPHAVGILMDGDF